MERDSPERTLPEGKDRSEQPRQTHTEDSDGSGGGNLAASFQRFRGASLSLKKGHPEKEYDRSSFEDVV